MALDLLQHTNSYWFSDNFIVVSSSFSHTLALCHCDILWLADGAWQLPIICIACAPQRVRVNRCLNLNIIVHVLLTLIVSSGSWSSHVSVVSVTLWPVLGLTGAGGSFWILNITRLESPSVSSSVDMRLWRRDRPLVSWVYLQLQFYLIMWLVSKHCWIMQRSGV